MRLESRCYSSAMGHSSAAMTARYTRVIPLAEVQKAFSSVQLENMENEAAG
jgi:hypothetical protein